MKKIQQFYVLSLNYERLKNNGFDLTLAKNEAFENEEIISLADNNCLRAIRQLSARKFSSRALGELLGRKRRLTRACKGVNDKTRVAEINEAIRDMLFVEGFVSVTFGSNVKAKEYNEFNANGFKINGKKYCWLLCGAGHQRTNRAMYCLADMYDELNKVLGCGVDNDTEVEG